MFPRRLAEFKKIAKECALYLYNSAKALAYKWLEVLIEENAGPLVQDKVRPQIEKIQEIVLLHLEKMTLHKIRIIAAYSCAISDDCGVAPNPYPCEIHARAAMRIHEYREQARYGNAATAIG